VFFSVAFLFGNHTIGTPVALKPAFGLFIYAFSFVYSVEGILSHF